jgi:glutamyl-tRNA synthetase
MAPNKGKLSKRKHGEVVSMTTYRDAGFLAAAFRNFLALLGWSAGEEKEIYTLAELIEKFSLEGTHRSNAVFNFTENDPRRWTDDKAQWMNAEYIRTLPLDELLPFVRPELKAAKLYRDEYEDDDKAWFENTINLIRQRFFTLKDFSNQGRAYFSEDYDFDTAAIEKNLSKFPDLKTWLPELADRFEAEFAEDTSVSSPHVSKGSSSLPFIEENIETVIKAFTEEKGTKLGVIMNGSRTLLTGVAVGPSMLSVFETIGLERSIMRLRSQIAWSI